MDPNQVPTDQTPQPVTPQPTVAPVAPQAQQFSQTPAPAQPIEQPQPSFAAQSPSSGGSSKTKLPVIIAVIVGVLLLAGIGIAVAMSGKKDAPVASTTKPKATMPVAAEPKPTTPSKTGAQTIPLNNKVIVDDEMGYTIRATSLGIGNFAIPDRYKANNSDKTVVTVHFKNSDTNKFSGSAKYLVLSLITSDGEKVVPTSLNDTDLTAAGLVELGNSKEVNDTVEGEELYWVPTAKLDKLTLRYKRLAAGVIGSDKTIPAKEFDIVLR